MTLANEANETLSGFRKPLAVDELRIPDYQEVEQNKIRINARIISIMYYRISTELRKLGKKYPFAKTSTVLTQIRKDLDDSLSDFLKAEDVSSNPKSTIDALLIIQSIVKQFPSYDPIFDIILEDIRLILLQLERNSNRYK